MTPKPKKEKWEEEFDKEFVDIIIPTHQCINPELIKSFLSQQIKKAEKEILEKVRLEEKKDSFEPYENGFTIIHYNSAVADLEALKEKLKKGIKVVKK